MRGIQYSAFGSTEPVHDAGGDRIRWFCPWYVDEQDALERALDTAAALEGEAGVSRCTVRIISTGQLSPCLAEVLARREFKDEARMVLADGRVITYIARCHPRRRSSPGDVHSEAVVLESITAQAPKGAATIQQQFRQLRGFRVAMVHPGTLSVQDTDRLLAIHRTTFPTFPYDFENKLALMLGAPDSYLMCLVRSVRNEQIYAFSNLEFNEVVLGDASKLHLAEYDNSMRIETCPEHGEVRGLGAIIRLQLAREADRRGVDLCHAESRAGLAAINGISHQVGMHFGGRLDNHLLISGRSDINREASSKYESMNVWYFNRTHLATLGTGSLPDSRGG